MTNMVNKVTKTKNPTKMGFNLDINLDINE